MTSDKKHVLLIYQAMIPSVRLCGHCQLETLQRKGLLDYRAAATAEVRDSDLNWADIIVLGRLDSWYEHSLARAARRAGKYLMYILDDDLLNVPGTLTSGQHYSDKKVRENILGMIGLSDAILSPSPLLLEKYAGRERRGISMIEPAVEPVSYRPHDPASPVRIGFAGSVDRLGDVEQILKTALMRLKDRYGSRVEFCFYGPRPSFAGDLNARHIPYSESYDDYRQTINSLDWDIGLAPMPDAPFHACKHYNKFIEYAAAGIGGIFSDVPPYTRLKEELGIGVFCDNTADAWYEALAGLVEDDARREQLRKASLDCARGPMSVDAAAENFRRALETVEISGCQKKIHCVKINRVRGYAHRGVDFLRRNGKNAPAAALKKLKALRK